jgi:porin
MTRFSSKWILSHSTWYKFRRSRHPQFLPSGAPAWQTEHGVEFNTLLNVLPMIIVQPVIQYYANVGGGAQRAVVFGFRTKVEF